MDYGNIKITSMRLYLRRRNVAAKVAEEVNTVTYAKEERRKNPVPLRRPLTASGVGRLLTVVVLSDVDPKAKMNRGGEK